MPSPESQQTVSRFHWAHCGRAWKGARVCRAPSPFGDGSPLPTGKVPSDVAYCRWIRSEKDQPSRWSERWKFVLFDGRVRWRWGGNKKRQGKTQRVKTGQASSVRTPLKRQDKTTEVSHDFPPCTQAALCQGQERATLAPLWPGAGPAPVPHCQPRAEGPTLTHMEGASGRPRAGPGAGSTDTCKTHTARDSSHHTDGHAPTHPLWLSRWWQRHFKPVDHTLGKACWSELYQVWKKNSKWWMENLLPWRAAPALQTKSYT